jgi:amino acid transporter
VGLGDLGKRLLVGRKLRSTQLRQTLLPKRIALPIFASDALSSVAYAPDEIFIVLSYAGIAAYAFSWKIGLAVAAVLLVVVASYRQNVRAYPSGGGDYEVATVNLGQSAGLVVASALLLDYTLTVAVSISSAAQYAATAIESLQGHQATAAIVATLFLMTMNLRGVRESGIVFAIPTYLFMVAVLGMVALGFARYVLGDLPQAPTAELRLVPPAEFGQGLAGLAGAMLLLRAFASGSAALTGVEAISNGVPAFRRPKGANAATTLLMLGVIAATMGLGVTVLARLMDVRMAENPAVQLVRPDGTSVGENYHQQPVISQLAAGIFDFVPGGFSFVSLVTGLILVLAANTAFNGFPVLGSILGRDGFLPRQLHTRGDRLAFSNGIVALAGFAIVLILAFDAEVTRLIQLYIVGVFTSFTLGQAGMVRHWNRLLSDEPDPATRRRMMRSRAINAVGFVVTAVVLAVVLVTKFVHGAWITVVAMAVLYAMMRGIRRHYDTVAAELAVDPSEELTLPSKVHAIVLVSKMHKPTLRALAFARAARPDVLEAITVDVDPPATRELLEEWDRRRIPVPLRVLASPYREITRPVVDYVRHIRRSSPRDVVTVYIPEYVLGRWWEQLLHNQSALRLKGRLLFTPGVMVTSVPYQLRSSEAANRREERHSSIVGDVRRGASYGPATGTTRPRRPGERR